MMCHLLFFGVLLGWGAAIPLGPMNIEIIRRNLSYGSRYGVLFGFGACSADILYLILLSFGALAFLTHPTVLRIIGAVGSCIIAWFGWSAIRMKPQINKVNCQQSSKPGALLLHYMQGMSMTLINPITVLFWASVSSQVASIAHKGHGALFWAGAGVFVGTISWVCMINTLLQIMRHRFSDLTTYILNIIGGAILLLCSGFGLLHFIL